ncbi:MAG: hypothetical protein EPO26_13150 [Chloroflexota bacterium]|nr:MAG: hypothetical protein EPO26_13150 [Chloroflexota bacterium]
MDVLIGIDVGSSNLKVAAFDRQGRLVASGQRGYDTVRPLISPPPHSEPRPERGFVEQDPEEWIDLCGEIIREMLAAGAFRPEDVRGIAPTGRGSGASFVDGEGRVLMRHYTDGRAGPQHRELVARFGPEADNRALASKTLHLKQEHPDLFARMRYPLCVHDFLLFRLSGVVATDPSSGPRTPDAIWPRDVWEWIGVPYENVPPVRPHTDIVGTLLSDTAARLGLPPGIPIGNGGHDGACANIGAGAISIGQVCMTMGTNGVARSISSFPAQQIPWRGISAYHYLPGRWCCGGDASYAGAVATWLSRIVGGTHDELEAEARVVPPGSHGVTFLPFLGGQIAPERRSEARGAYLGMSIDTNRAVLYRATMEGVGYLYRSIERRLEEMDLGEGEWRVSGGGAKSPLWMRIMASLLERQLLITEPEEGPRGAAMVTAVGLGWYRTVEECGAEWVRIVQRVDPDRALTEAYLPHYARYTAYADAVYRVEAQS